MALTLKKIISLEKKIHKHLADNKSWREIHAPITHAEALRALYCARKYKEMMLEFDRYFKQHKISSMAELAKKLAEIEA